MDHFGPLHARNHTVIPGVGTIFTQGVGNAFTSSLEHLFKAEDAERRVMGRVLFGVRIADDGTTHWVVEEITGPSSRRLRHGAPRPTEADQTDFPPEAMAEMRRLSETLEERSPVGWFFDVLHRAEDDLRHLDRKRSDLIRGIEHRDELLRDPDEPRQHFVSKEKSGRDKGFLRSATTAERDARRAEWTEMNRIDRACLSRHDAASGQRTRMLRSIVLALRQWSRIPNDERTRLPSEVMTEAVASVRKPIAA